MADKNKSEIFQKITTQHLKLSNKILIIFFKKKEIFYYFFIFILKIYTFIEYFYHKKLEWQHFLGLFFGRHLCLVFDGG
ncbi:hypothetical protein [Spiroplasma ixodetis]|uniref:hypothetical protein n=1 Tax=Spiroplasma ixodetis TaxID=2141 RepID=UPI002577E168|nr:hypothetical protein [Spiroplasma ixodetis]